MCARNEVKKEKTDGAGRKGEGVPDSCNPGREEEVSLGMLRMEKDGKEKKRKKGETSKFIRKGGLWGLRKIRQWLTILKSSRRKGEKPQLGTCLRARGKKVLVG